MENKRAFPRFDSTFQVRYSPEGGNMPRGYTISNDISRGGLRMPSSSGILAKGDIVNLEMESADSTRYIPAVGKVRWLKAIDRNAPLDEEVGIEFIDIRSVDIDNLLKKHR